MSGWSGGGDGNFSLDLRSGEGGDFDLVCTCTVCRVFVLDFAGVGATTD